MEQFHSELFRADTSLIYLIRLVEQFATDLQSTLPVCRLDDTVIANTARFSHTCCSGKIVWKSQNNVESRTSYEYDDFETAQIHTCF